KRVARAGVERAPPRGAPPLKADNAMHRLQPLPRLQNLPTRNIAERDLENVEIERGIEVVAKGTLASEIVDPGRDPTLEIDGMVQRHSDAPLIVAGAQLIADIEVE